MVGARLAPCLLLTWLCLWGFGKGPPGPRHLQLAVGGDLQEVSERQKVAAGSLQKGLDRSSLPREEG